MCAFKTGWLCIKCWEKMAYVFGKIEKISCIFIPAYDADGRNICIG